MFTGQIMQMIKVRVALKDSVVMSARVNKDRGEKVRKIQEMRLEIIQQMGVHVACRHPLPIELGGIIYKNVYIMWWINS